MRWTIANCDILERPADVLILSGNPQLNLSGGAGGAFRLRYGDEMQTELHRYLEAGGKKFVEPGTVVKMPPFASPYVAVLHAIGLDAFYDSSVNLIRATVRESLAMAAELGAKTVALTAIATGYGRMSIKDFAQAVQPLLSMDFHPIDRVEICLLKPLVSEELVRLLPEATIDDGKKS